jgi:futalosine hydrolase
MYKHTFKHKPHLFSLNAEICNMKVLITAATSMELTFLQKQISFIPKATIYYAVTGIGAVSTVYHLMELLKKDDYELMIQMGIAGCFDNQVPLGRAVTIEKEWIAEMGVVENQTYKDIFQLNLADPNEAPYKSGALINPHQTLMSKTGLSQSIGVTNNLISTDETIIARYKTIYAASIESMEGAAFHYVGIMQSIPFVQIRGISNYIGERNKEHWKIKEALQSATEACQHLLEQL